jgi:hypothetical protein
MQFLTLYEDYTKFNLVRHDINNSKLISETVTWGKLIVQ